MRNLTVAFAAMCLLRCASIGYVAQAAGGQLALIRDARPVHRVINDPATPPHIKRLLSEIGPIKRFGLAHGLVPTANYRQYVALDRPAVVWVVSASDALEFKSRVWTFPLVGAFPYLGWFDLESAKRFALELKSEGLDVDLRGASAYSTLGWFADPLLSSMLGDGDEAVGYLVNTVIHESVHATLHIPSEAYFNESLASFVAAHLSAEYLDWKYGTGSPEALSYAALELQEATIEKRLAEAHLTLETLYASAASNPEKLRRKAALLGALKAQLGLRRDVNNASLIQHRTYATGYSEFEQLYRACNSSWARFFTVLRTLTPESFSGPHQRDFAPALTPLLRQGC